MIRKMKCPCKGCPDRTITCHGVCKKYHDWKKDLEERKEWLNKNKNIQTEQHRQNVTRMVRRNAKGHNGGNAKARWD